MWKKTGFSNGIIFLWLLFIIFFLCVNVMHRSDILERHQSLNVNNSFFFSPITSLFNLDPFPSSSTSPWNHLKRPFFVIDSKWIQNHVECEVNTIRIITGFGKVLLRITLVLLSAFFSQLQEKITIWIYVMPDLMDFHWTIHFISFHFISQ